LVGAGFHGARSQSLYLQGMKQKMKVASTPIFNIV
jgi:hypothetical protein